MTNIVVSDWNKVRYEGIQIGKLQRNFNVKLDRPIHDSASSSLVSVLLLCIY